MVDFTFLISIAIILVSTRMLSDISNKAHMPQVVGALIAGVVLGPSVLGLISETEFLQNTAEIGVIILMFTAGLDTDVEEMKKNWLPMLLIAGLGVIIPFLGGFGIYWYFFDVSPNNYTELLRAVFMGVVLTATSVSITVEALRELGRLKTRAGSAILGAAVLDDIIGIVVLTIVTSLKDDTISVRVVLTKILLYILALLAMTAVFKCFKIYIERVYRKNPQRICVFVFAMALAIAYVSEEFFGIADITGAYLLGLMHSGSTIRDDVARKMAVPSYLFFSPIFFASIGIKTELGALDMTLVTFSIILLVIAIATKILGCGLGAKLCGYSNYDALNIGVGMVSRGEVALIVAQKGYGMGLMDPALFSPIIFVVIATTILTPVLLKRTLQLKNE